MASPRIKIFSDLAEDTNLPIKSHISHRGNYMSNDVITEDNNDEDIDKDIIKVKTGSTSKLETFLDKSESIDEVTYNIHGLDNITIDIIAEEQNEEDVENNKKIGNIKLTKLVKMIDIPLSDDFDSNKIKNVCSAKKLFEVKEKVISEEINEKEEENNSNDSDN